MNLAIDDHSSKAARRKVPLQNFGTEAWTSMYLSMTNWCADEKLLFKNHKRCIGLQKAGNCMYPRKISNCYDRKEGKLLLFNKLFCQRINYSYIKLHLGLPLIHF